MERTADEFEATSEDEQQSSQVEIRKRPVCWANDSEIRDSSNVLVFFDDYHCEIIIVTESYMWFSHSSSSSLTKFPFSVHEQEHLKNAKLSPDHCYIGFQIDSTEIKILNRDGNMVAMQTCRNSKAHNKILSFYWLTSDAADLCLVTIHGAELYKLNATGRVLKCVKTFKYETKHHWSLATHQFMVLVDSKHVFQGLQITKSKPEKINKFEIVGVQKSTLEPRTNFYHQITLLDFSNTVGCVFVDEKKAKVYVFMLHKDHRKRATMKLTNQFELYSRGTYRISLVDFVLVAFNVNTQTFALLDLNESEVEPVCVPNSIIKIEDTLEGATHCSKLTHVENRTKFLKPCYILDLDECCFWTLELNLNEIISKWNKDRRFELLKFLLKRNTQDSKQSVLKLLGSLIETYCTSTSQTITEFQCIASYFSCINHILYQWLTENQPSNRPGRRSREKTISGFTVLRPTEIVQYVLQPYLSLGPRILNVVIEYVRSLLRNKLKVPHAVTELVVHLCDQHNDYYSLHQLMQYHALPDDETLANKLLGLSDAYPPAKQLAIDMMLRLKMWPTIVELLLSENNVLSALSLYLDEFHIWLNNNNNEMTFPISLFLETAQNLEDPVLFYNVFRRIESEQVPDFELALQDFRPYYSSLLEPRDEE